MHVCEIIVGNMILSKGLEEKDNNALLITDLLSLPATQRHIATVLLVLIIPEERSSGKSVNPHPHNLKTRGPVIIEIYL